MAGWALAWLIMAAVVVAAAGAAAYAMARRFGGPDSLPWGPRFWGILAAGCAFRILAAFKIGVTFDEGYYFYWALFPQLSYYDHPPLVAWGMAVSHALFGNTVLAVRFWPLVAGTVTVLSGRWLARMLFGPMRGDIAGVLLAGAPFIAGAGLLMTPDTLLMPAWTLALCFTWKALDGNGRGNGWWAAAGAAAGIGLLSKYSMILYFMGLAVLWLVMPGRRRALFVGALIATPVAALLFMPVVVWNMQNEWVSFRFQLAHGLTRNGGSPMAHFMRYAVGCLIGATPLPMLLALRSAVGRSVLRDPRFRFAAVYFLTVLVFFGVSSLKGESEANWVLPSLVPGMVLLGGDWPNHTRWLRRLTMVSMVAIMLVLGAGTLAYVCFPSSLSSAGDVAMKLPEIVGGEGTAETVRKAVAEHKIDKVCCDSHQLLGRLGFYAPELRGRMYLTSRNRLRFPWLRVETFNNQPVLIVSSRSALKDVAPWIKDIKYVGRGEIKGDGGEPLDTLLFYTGRCGIDREPTGN